MVNDLPGGGGGFGNAQPIQMDLAALTQAAQYVSGLADQVRAERERIQQAHEAP